ncbi:hypothetical protein [Candidatus Korarchaeum cryptofilum]|jgi:hypothetical protein|uniref:Nucleotidyltransferase n=1 Tax=Korarchaeum cryptofilum (strain OPF8) TaxID=374847 RepID=B1L3R3_KORCO|nr:hypothetical protein [Candidatus Korarchaeum cryptofilum]ACB07092.1 hypothetical protein Kcr_0334 [Candidatus Korarchaeum cryptofilum OPF8]
MSHEGIHFVEIDPEEFVKECKAIIDKLEERGIIARILGAMAVYIHTERDKRAREIHSTRFGAGVPMFTDLDLMAYKKQAKKLKEVFERELGFLPDRMVNVLFSDRRLIYYHPEGKFHVDVFFNKLEFCHDVNFGEEPGKGRLELSKYAITPTDVVLEKLQIHEINPKDIVDLIVLFLTHELAEEEGEGKINAKYIAKVLADDWGFWYDSVENLKKVKAYASQMVKEGRLKEEEMEKVIRQVDLLLKIIEEEPKSKNWMKRAKEGTSKKWWRDVEEIVR